MDLYSHVLAALKSEAAERMDQILNPLVVKMVVKEGGEKGSRN
jgi:hypothetical protein